MVRINQSFKNEEGAIDLTSIMVGVIALGLIGGVIAATVFAVIPWSQDKAAQQQLDSIVAAQSAYKGLSSGVPPATPANHPANSYANSSLLASAGLLTEDDNYCTVETGAGSGYQAVARSGSGKYWTVTDTNTKPVAIAPLDIPIGCDFPDIDLTPKLTKLSYNCPTTKTIPVPISNGSGVATWSDGEVVNYSGSEIMTKTLTAGVDYQLSFDGTYQTFSSPPPYSADDCLRSLDHWGSETGVTNASYAFMRAANLIDVPRQIPSTIVDVQGMFMEATSINDPDISRWEMSNTTNMSSMFYEASSFNQPLENWDVSNVTQMVTMFESASSFNQPLESWDVSKVTTMHRMFRHAHSFNKPLGKWDVSNVTDMNSMFSEAWQFNHPLNEWDVSKVKDMDSMFGHTYYFNQPLDEWDVSNVTTMYATFDNTHSFNHPLNEWDVSHVTNMSRMFNDARVFNQPLDKWNTSSVTNMSHMFNFIRVFNQPLNDWDVSKVEDFSLMFNEAAEFNQPLNDWDVRNAKTMHRMMDGSGNKFNQDLSGWDTASLLDGTSFARKAFPVEKLPKSTSVDLWD